MVQGEKRDKERETGRKDGRHSRNRARVVRLRGQRRVPERAQRQSLQPEHVTRQGRESQQEQTHAEAVEASAEDAEEAHQQVRQEQQASAGRAAN